jgi:hypothetical protein
VHGGEETQRLQLLWQRTPRWRWITRERRLITWLHAVEIYSKAIAVNYRP